MRILDSRYDMYYPSGSNRPADVKVNKILKLLRSALILV